MDNEEIYDFGIRLRQFREERGLSRRAFAQKLGVSKETIYRYENNVQALSLERMKQIAIILQTSIDYLAGLNHDYIIKIPGLSMEQRNALNLFLRAFIDK